MIVQHRHHRKYPHLSVASEESAEELKRSVLAKTGGITDVVAAIGAWWQKGPVLDQSLEELTMVCHTEKLCCGLLHVWVHSSMAFTLVAAFSAVNACTHTKCLCKLIHCVKETE